MAPGLPYAIGIQHAFRGRQVIAYVGDGGFEMLMAEFLTAVQGGPADQGDHQQQQLAGADRGSQDGAGLPRAQVSASRSRWRSFLLGHHLQQLRTQSY